MTWNVFVVLFKCRANINPGYDAEVATLTFELAAAKEPGVVAVAPSNAVISKPQLTVVELGSLTVTVRVCATPGV